MTINSFVYWSDGLEGGGHLNITVETGVGGGGVETGVGGGVGAGHLPTKIARWAGHLTNFFKFPGFAQRFARRSARG